jgi:two-component system OmpR family sensor kinase
MVRHFLTLYALIVATLAGVSWGQDQLIRVYERRYGAAVEDPERQALFAIATARLAEIPAEQRSEAVGALAERTGIDLELLELQDIAGESTLLQLASGHHAVMTGANGQTWVLHKLADADQVLAFKYAPVDTGRTPLEWALVLVFYAAIALVIMLWLWPLQRDLRELERSTMAFGDRNWRFVSRIGPRSQIYPLAQAFRRMAERIDRLIGSHKDMSNAMSHEIKTPLARMRFEIEMARTETDRDKLGEHLDNLNRDIAELNSFVTATLEYAILERAEMALNLAEHDFTQILPAIAESVRRNALTTLAIDVEIAPEATNVVCDAHLMETVVRNLLHNALRHADRKVCLSFEMTPKEYVLRVDDDGPGIAPADRQRVFESFVQLEQRSGTKTGFGLGLAIVKRAIEWHNGSVAVAASHLGGAQFEVRWPRSLKSGNEGRRE